MLIERLPIPDAAAQELGPLRNHRRWIAPFRQQGPQVGVVPAQIVLRAVPVCPYARPEHFDLGQQFLPGHGLKIIIHGELLAQTPRPIDELHRRGLVP